MILVFCFLNACMGKNESKTEDTCGDLDPYPTEFDITDCNLNIQLDNENNLFPNRIYGTPYNEGENISFDQLVISIESIFQVISFKKKENKRFLFPIIKSAYACSPVSPPIKRVEIVEINITSSYDFNDATPAGSTLNSLFNVRYSASETPFYRYVNAELQYFSLSEYLEQEHVYAGQVIQLKLNTEPDYVDPYYFYIDITLDNGDIFQLVSPAINFEKL